MAYLRIFDPQEGVREVPLRKGRIVIGRQPGVDILLEQETVSRIHAVLHEKDNGYVIEDANSRSGTIINDNKVSRSPLRHGVNIQICSYVLEYRTDDKANETRLNVDDDSPIDHMMRANFKVMPIKMNIRYRQLSCSPTDLFETGDTLNIGGGGVLIPTVQPLESASVLELEITWPNRKTKTLLGEVMAVLRSKKCPGMCVKLHQIEGELYRRTLMTANRGSWVNVPHVK